jgi:hypothetical protein
MRTLSVIALIGSTLPRLLACSCIPGSSTPCDAAGGSSAAFIGMVLQITEPTPPVASLTTGDGKARRVAGDGPVAMPRLMRKVRIQVHEVLSGVDPSQSEIEVLTGQGGGDCGYSFQVGTDYVIYANKDAEGSLVTGICSRTKPLAQAIEDVDYFRAMAGAPATSSLRVQTSLRGSPGRPGALIVAEQGQSRFQSVTNAAGDAVFSNLAPGEYAIHAEADGDLPDDPKVELHAKGCTSMTLFRMLRLVGHVTTRSGQPASRIEVEYRPTKDAPGDGMMTGQDGEYEIRIARPGQYYLGINLNHTPTRGTPYPRWFYPGTEDPALATKIDFTGKPETRTFDFILPDRQLERTIEGIVLTREGEPKPRAVVTVVDASRNVIAQGNADPAGRFALHVFVETPYRLYAGWPGSGAEAVSAPPLDIQPGSTPLNLRLLLTQPGNAFMDEGRNGAARK